MRYNTGNPRSDRWEMATDEPPSLGAVQITEGAAK